MYDNIFVDRSWWTVKYEEVYVKDYEDMEHTRENLERYFVFYNEERLHQSLGYATPASVCLTRPPRKDPKGRNRLAVSAGVPVALRASSVPAEPFMGSTDYRIYDRFPPNRWEADQ